MTLLFPMLLALAGLLCWPAFAHSRKTGPESWWLLFLSGPAVVVWVGLTGSGYGAQSLSNLVEVFWLVGSGVLLCYVKVFIVDRLLPKSLITTYLLAAILVAGAALLRTFMPVLPE